jgi:hypothetical protein
MKLYLNYVVSTLLLTAVAHASVQDLIVAPTASNDEIEYQQRKYDEENLDSEARARQDAALLAEKIKLQVHNIYENLLKDNKNDEEARASIKELIENDLALIDESLRGDIRSIAMKALDEVQYGVNSSEDELASLQVRMKNRTVTKTTAAGFAVNGINVGNVNFIDPASDQNRQVFASKAQLMESLLSNRPSTRWLSTSNSVAKSRETKSVDRNVSIFMDVEFLGVKFEGGPSLTFSREYESAVSYLVEGHRPFILDGGVLDLRQYDETGKVIMKDGKPAYRFAAFYCTQSLSFKTKLNGGARLTLAGTGGGTTYEKSYENYVSADSRRISIPQVVGGQLVRFQDLEVICAKDFLNARISNTKKPMTLKQALNLNMKNIVSTLTYSHPQSTCAIDAQCTKWYARGGVPLFGNRALPRCEISTSSGRMACVAKGKVGMKCPIINNGKRLSDGMFELPCDRGLRCVQTKEYGWFKSASIFQYAEGQCRR